MEAIMPAVVAAVVGALAATCAFGLTGAVAGEGALGAAGGRSPGKASPDLRILARALGGWLRSVGVAGFPPVAAAARELAMRASRAGRASGGTGPEAIASTRTSVALRDAVAVDADAALGALAACSLASGAAGALLSMSPVGAALGIAAPVAALAALGARRRVDEARELESAMPEAFGALAIALGSGQSLSQAMRFVGAHADEPVRTEFTRVSFAIDCGVSAPEALDGMLERLPAPGLDLVALALKVSQRTGAPLKELLSEAAQLVGTRIELKRMLDVKTSQARMSARLVASMPVAMVCVLALLSPDFRRGITMPAGAGAVALALALNAVAWSIINRIMKVRL